MDDRSIHGLLMRAHAEIAGQAHGDEFFLHNIPAKCDWENALQSVEAAIKSVHFAEMRQRVQEAIEKESAKHE